MRSTSLQPTIWNWDSCLDGTFSDGKIWFCNCDDWFLDCSSFAGCNCTLFEWFPDNTFSGSFLDCNSSLLVVADLNGFSDNFCGFNVTPSNWLWEGFPDAWYRLSPLIIVTSLASPTSTSLLTVGLLTLWTEKLRVLAWSDYQLPSFLPLAALWATCQGICRSLCACSLGAWWLNRSGGLRWKSRKAITCSSRVLCGAAIAPQAAQTKEKATTPLIRPTERCPEQALLSVGAGQIRGFGFIVELPGLLSRTEAMVGCLMTTSLLLSTSPQQKLKA